MEIQYFNNNYERRVFDIDEITHGEQEYYDIIEKDDSDKIRNLDRQRKQRQAARKRHRAELLAPHLKHLNFVLFWPHMTRAHPELYQRWDDNNIIMVGREEIRLTKELAMDILYEGDAPVNEASMHALIAAPALVICFRLLDTDKHFIDLVRKILYEDVISSEEKPNNKTAYEQYLTYSLSANAIRKNRKDEKERIKAEELHKRARRLSEMRRLALQAKEEAIKEKKLRKEQMRLNALKSGNLTALEAENEDDDIEDIVIPEELPDDVPEESSSTDEDEYFPPEGLLVPGFYSPPNDIAKANGLPLLFPKIVSEYVVPPPEFLPEHVLVLLNITKRYKAIKVLKPYYKKYLLHLGIFKTTETLEKIKHVAYSVKQFDTILIPLDNIKLAIMISTTIDLPLLELVDLVPDYISRDNVLGEIDCSKFFPVNYCDEGTDFEDFIYYQ